MPRPRLTWDRFTDYHLFLGFAAALAAAGAAALALLGNAPDAGPAARVVGWVLVGAAAALALWAVADRRAERRRRARLDKHVDGELSGKWQAGFARVVGAYDKPWYLLCGETGVGKTAALRAADLPRAVGPGGRPVTDAGQGLHGTFMFDWWFFRDAVVLDSAGDLIENPDQRWVSFLERVRESRPLQPVNGMLLAVSAADLLKGGRDAAGRDALRRKALLLARQVDVARQQLRVRFPLYLLITKTDLIPGFADYFDTTESFDDPFADQPGGPSTPSASAGGGGQILGWSNPQDPRADDRPAAAADVRAGLAEVIDVLRARRSGSLVRVSASAGRTGLDGARRIDQLDDLFLFPAGAAGLLDGLEVFVDELLARTGGTTPPFLRGVYLTSARPAPAGRRRADAGAQVVHGPAEVGQILDDFRGPRGGDGAEVPAAGGAHFLRDLLQDKVIPEGGMVTPLEDVVSGVRRRGRVLVTAAVAAAVVIGCGTAWGYFQTVARVRPHRAYWDDLAAKARADRLSDLALFDADGRYRGDAPVGAAGGAAGGRTVLQFHARGAALADDRASTWLLPLSGRMDESRRAAQRRVFHDLVLLPALTPPPTGRGGGRPAGPPPAALAEAVLPFARGSGPVPAADLVRPATELVKLRSDPAGSDAGDVLDAGQVRQITDLLRHGGGLAGPAETVRVPPASRRRAAEFLEAWLKDALDRRARAADDWAAEAAPQLAAARDMADREARLLPALAAAADAERADGVLAQLASGTPSVRLDATTPAARSVAERLDLPAALLDLRAAIRPGTANVTAATAGPVEPDRPATGDHALAAAIDAHESALVAAGRRVAAAAGVKLPDGAGLSEVRRGLAAGLDEFDRRHLGPARPRLLARRDAYAGLHQAVRDALAADGAAARFAAVPAAAYPHPFFRLHPVLDGIRGRIGRADDAMPAAPYGPPADDADRALAARFDAACRRALDLARAEGESRAWDAALARPDQVWLTAAAVARPAGKLDLSVYEGESSSLVRSYVPSPDLDPRHLAAWVAALSDAEAELGRSRVHDPAATKARLDAVAAGLERTANESLASWQAAARQMQAPNLARWRDLGRLGGDRPDQVHDRLNQSLDKPRAALDAMAAQSRFPALKQAATKARAPLNDRALPPTAAAVFALLKACDPKSAAATRDAILRDRRLRDEVLPQATVRGEPGASAVQDFWAELADRPVGLLVADARPAAVERLRRVRAAAVDAFPLCRRGAGAWAAADVAPLRADLDALRPPGAEGLTNAAACRVRDLDAVDDGWAAYIDWLRRLDAALQARDVWTVEISKSDRRGSWQAVSVAQPGATGGGKGGGAGGSAVAEQTYLGGDRPPVFSVEGGGSLRAGLAVSLLTKLKQDGGADACTFATDRLREPWGALRLAAANGDLPFTLPVIDAAAPAQPRAVVVRLQPTDTAAAVLRDMPNTPPAVPE